MNIQDFGFTNGFKCSDVHKIEKLTRLSIIIFLLGYHQDQIKWKHRFLHMEFFLKNSHRVVASIIYKNHYVPVEKGHVFSGNQICRFVCGRCLSSYTSQKTLIKHK